MNVHTEFSGMEVFVREYQPADKLQLIELIEILQDFVVNIDPIRRLRRLTGSKESKISLDYSDM